MDFKNIIETYITKKGWTKYRLAKEAGIGQSTLSEILSGKKKNPSINTLQKIANALNITLDELMGTKSVTKETLNKWDDKYSNMCEEIKEVDGFYSTGEFKTAEAAMKFILEQPAIMGYGGFDVNKMSDEEIMEFANELLHQLQILGFKYKK